MRRRPSDRPSPLPGVGRRAVLLGGLAAGLAGCTEAPTAGSGAAPASTGIPSPSSSSPSATPTGPSPSPSPTPALPPLPANRVFAVAPNEPEPQAKERAIRLVEVVTSWDSGRSGQADVAARLAAQGIPGERAAAFAAATATFRSAAAEATSGVISAQYGGLTAASASLLVTYEQWTRAADGSVVRGGSGADVRLAREAGEWRVSEVFAASPGPPVSPVPALVQAVLSNANIRLPPSAAADVAAGDLRPKPMQALLDLARDYEIDVSIVYKPHPDNVFATDRLSDHTRRRAWDIWAVNGQTVIAESTPDALVDGFLQAARDAGAYNVGGPRLLSGAGFFSDRTHRDHCHIAFSSDT